MRLLKSGTSRLSLSVGRELGLESGLGFGSSGAPIYVGLDIGSSGAPGVMGIGSSGIVGLMPGLGKMTTRFLKSSSEEGRGPASQC